ncbi:hypothetical protein [Streptomyces sp. BA2]|nr:hypothetical protein [Streptomyces sp. BA2]MWA09170.1 hypothetical protein [Streptomyces sp. BA2]
MPGRPIGSELLSATAFARFVRDRPLYAVYRKGGTNHSGPAAALAPHHPR